MGLIDMIAAERVAIADDIDGLDADAAATRSLCSEWTVHQAAAHLISPFEIRTLALIKGIVTHGFNVNKTNRDFAARIAAERDLPSIATTLRENRYHPFKPPGYTLAAPLTDAVVHSQDIRRPLGLAREFESETLRAVLDFVTSPAARRGFIPKSRLEGLTFRATDLEWRTEGEGQLVEGPSEPLIMAITGRRIDLAPLSGPGVATLRARIGA